MLIKARSIVGNPCFHSNLSLLKFFSAESKCSYLPVFYFQVLSIFAFRTLAPAGIELATRFNQCIATFGNWPQVTTFFKSMSTMESGNHDSCRLWA